MKWFFDRMNLLLNPEFVMSAVLLVVFFFCLRLALQKGKEVA